MLGRNTEHTRTPRKALVCCLLLGILFLIFFGARPAYAGPSITTITPAGSVGYTISLSGSGFSLLDTSCTISGLPVSQVPAPSCTIAGGSVTGSFIVNSAKAVSFQVTVTGIPTGDFAQAAFRWLSLSQVSGQVGSGIEVFGAGFSSSDSACFLSGTVVGEPNACVIDGTGTLSGAFAVANLAPGFYPGGVIATGTPGGDSASADFLVTNVTCRPTPSPFPFPTPPPPSYPAPPTFQAANCGSVDVSPGKSDLKLGDTFPTFYNGSLPLQSVKLTYPNSSILTNSIGDLLFAVTLDRVGIYSTVSIFIPPDFTGLSITTQVWTSFTNNYNPSSLGCSLGPTGKTDCSTTLRLIQVSSTDSVAPNWWEIQIQSLAVTCGGPIQPDPSKPNYCPLNLLTPTNVENGRFFQDTTQYIRVFAVTSPAIAGRYFFKAFLNDTSIGANLFPTLVVKASKDPAYISGVLRYAENKNPSLVGKPIQLRPGEGAQVIATGYDYLGNPQEAQTFLNSTAEGNFTLFGVAPGTYNITAYAAGFVPAINAITVSVVAAQSLDQVNIYLFQSANITGIVYSEDENRQPVPWGVVYPSNPSLGVCQPAFPIITAHINPITGQSNGQVFECPRSIVIEALAVNENGTVVAQTPFPSRPSLFTDPTSSNFTFSISDVGWDGRIPQDGAYYTSGLGWGDYYLRAYVTQYVQFDNILVHVNNNTLDVESDIPLFRSGIFTVTVHFKDFNSTLIETPIPVAATLTASAYDLEGNLVAQNVTSVPAGSGHNDPPIELIGFSEISTFGFRTRLDYGIRPGTYHIVMTLTSSPVFSGFANVGVKNLFYQLSDFEGTIGLAPIDTQVSLSMYEAGALNLVMYSVDAESPSLPVNWVFPDQTISIQVISSQGVVYSTNATQPSPLSPLFTSSVVPLQTGPTDPESGTSTSLSFFYNGLLTDTYGVLVETVGYQREFFHVHVTLGMNTDIRVNLLQMPVVNLTLAFRNEGLLTSIDSKDNFTQPLNQLDATPVRLELYDSNGNLAGATISYIPDSQLNDRTTYVRDFVIAGFNQYYGDPKSVWAGFYDTTDATLQPEGGLQPGTYTLLIWVDGYYQSTPLNFTLQLRENASLVGSVERASRISGVISGPDYYGQSRPLSWAIINLVPTGNETESRLPGWSNGMWLPGGFNYTTPSLDGFYQLWVPGDGPYSISVSLPGYVGYSGTIFVALGSDLTLDYFLDTLPAPSYAYAQTQPLQPIQGVHVGTNSTLPNLILTTDILRVESKTRP
ncbi:MAG: carboxypeptidase-like regulatory domain-containing protein [Candidatus Bathyarchaeia archaeon]